MIPINGEHVFQVLRLDPVSKDVGLIAGDVIHNVRSALDHLVYQIAVDNGCKTVQTMFPVFDDAAKCVAMTTRKVAGLPQTFKVKIRDAEPYPRGQGHLFWILNKLDIADKHHSLLTSTVCMGCSQLGRGASSGPGMFVESVTFGAGPTKFGEPLKAGDKFLILPKGHGYQNVRFDFDVTISQPRVVDNIAIVMLLSNFISRADRLILECNLNSNNSDKIICASTTRSHSIPGLDQRALVHFQTPGSESDSEQSRKLGQG